jgi:hypothetical protein
MDFLFHVPFFWTADAVLTEILEVCFVDIEFLGHKYLISTKLKELLISSK